MKSKLLFFAIVAALLIGPSAFAQPFVLDTIGVVDTVAFELTVDTIALTAELEVWVYSDEALTGATIPMSWGGSPTLHFTVDSAKTPADIIAGFDLGRFYWEAGSLATSNANQRFLFGGASLFSGGLAPSASRRLWSTYYFTISQWDGYNADGIIIDTIPIIPPGSVYLFVAAAENANFVPWFAGSVQFGDPGLGAGDPTPDVPATYALSQNYPNPFNPTTEISFDVARTSHVKLTIYNILGQEVTTLVDKDMSAGKKSVTWDAGENSTGIYFYKLTAGDFTETRKMMLLK